MFLVKLNEIAYLTSSKVFLVPCSKKPSKNKTEFFLGYISISNSGNSKGVLQSFKYIWNANLFNHENMIHFLWEI